MLTLGAGVSGGLTASVNSSSEIQRVDFSSSNPSTASVAPGSDSSYGYQTQVTGNQVGSATVTGDVYFTGPTLACSATTAVGVISPGPWWQVEDGNVHANSGGISSQIPSACSGACLPNLITGLGGLLSFTGSVSLGDGTISQDGSDWNAETVYTGTRTGFAYFERLLQDDPAPRGVWDGGLPAQSGVSLAPGSVTTSGTWNVTASENFVLLADGDVIVNANIDVAPGGFLAIIASGDITINPSVTRIEGVFIADGTINTGLGDQQLVGEGIFTGWTNINFQRDLNDDSQTPAERFVYRPDLQLNAYRYLLWFGIDWREVAP